MRFRINKTFTGPKGERYTAGDVVDLVPGKVDEVWVKAGLIMQDKSLDAPAETKAVEPEQEAKGWPEYFRAITEPETPAPTPTRSLRRRGK